MPSKRGKVHFAVVSADLFSLFWEEGTFCVGDSFSFCLVVYFFIAFIFSLCVYTHMHVCVNVFVCACVCVEDKIWEEALSFYLVGSLMSSDPQSRW